MSPSLASSRDPEQSQPYTGSGTEADPFVVEFLKDDPGNPMNWSQSRKWTLAIIADLSVFAVTLTSSAYSPSSTQIMEEFHVSTEVVTLGLSLYVLGFAIGPALWVSLTNDRWPFIRTNTPRSELYGRRPLWIISHIAMVAFLAGSAGSNNIATLLVLRFLVGTFGGSPLVNSGGTIADLFPPAQRGLALTIYCAAPFLGPVIGPIVGGFVSQSIGWRWVQGICVIFLGIIGILGTILIPETYGPVLLRRRAHTLTTTDTNNRIYMSVLERNTAKQPPSAVFHRALVRPWTLLFREPIVLIASLYIAIIYGTIYMFMGAMPIVFNQSRGWSPGIGGLAFLGIAAGILLGLLYAIWDTTTRYAAIFAAGTATPESRLPPAILGAVALPVGMFAFAWTNSPAIHWAASIVLSAPFGVGCVLVILPIMTYLIDAYTVYAASVLAACAMFRSVVGAVFPLFTAQMYHDLGIHWASAVPAFLTLVCMPFPVVMYRYGAVVRTKCRYSFEAAEMMRKMHQMQQMQLSGGPAAGGEQDQSLD
ncbi:major facilitator superfamily domain-containing protein [Aspergillus heterothallicus]